MFFPMPCSSLYPLCERSIELVFGNLLVLENTLCPLSKVLGISIVDAGYVTGLLHNMLNNTPLSR